MRDLIECAFVANTALNIAYDLSKEMVERNLQVDEVLFIERSGGTYSFEIKCSNRFTREQLKAKIKELMTDGKTDRIIIERELGKGIYKEILEEALSELGDETC